MTSLNIATITLNVAYDLVGSCHSLKLGEVNRIQSIGLHAAGKGINVAKVLKKLGANVTVGGFLGRDNHDGFLQLFSDLGLINQFHTVPGRNRINVKLTEFNDQVTDLNFSGFKVEQTDWEVFEKESISWLKSFNMIVISGSFPVGIEPIFFTNWLIELKKHCRHIIFDSSENAFSAGIKAVPWLVKPNLNELEAWVGYPLVSMNDILDAARLLQNQGITHVIVSLGKEGALWLDGSDIWLAKPPFCEVVSTVGAGDSMVAGLAYGLSTQQSSKNTLRLATAIAALAVSQSNVGIENQTELKQMMERIELTSLNAQKSNI